MATAILVEIVARRTGRFWPRLLVQAACLAILTEALIRLIGSPVKPVFVGAPAQRLVEQLLVAGWWATVARLAVIAARLLLTHETRPRESRILIDLLAGLIYISATLSVISIVLSIPVGGLLATSGVIAIVLGLALQSTLGDLFSGIAVGVERPYRAGDHLSVDGGLSGRVVQVNWRSTHIRTGHDIAIVPNSVVAKSRLVNRSEPTITSGESAELRIHPEVPPAHVLSVLQAALLSCEGLAKGITAAPLCSGLAGDGVTYTLSFAASSVEDATKVRSDVLVQAHRHLFHAGIPLAIAGVPPVSRWEAGSRSIEELLIRSDLFSGVSAGNRVILGERVTSVKLETGDVLFRRGAVPDAMFIIAAGTVEVLPGDPETATRRYLLAPGESVGLVALVLAEPYRTTATALTPVHAFRLDTLGLSSALSEAPGLGGELEDAAGRALSIMARFDVGEEAGEAKERTALLQRLRLFLRVVR